MIRLEAVRLVNWYHFVDETFRMGGSCLLLGDNGCGKSTVLDAIELALVADMNQVRFNKAANENSRRTLYSYVRHKLGSEDETRPGAVRFGRPGCTSYVLLQFSGPRGEEAFFTAGVAMEAIEADTNVARWHFLLPGCRAADAPAVGPGDEVRTLKEFRAVIKERPENRVSNDPGVYRDELRHRLGSLPQDFHRLIVKALDFKPIGLIRNFVFEYLLDERPVDTAALQANLENYKKLEAQSRDAEERIAALSRICDQGERIGEEQHTAESHRFLYLRADVELAEQRRSRALADRDSVQRRQAELASEAGQCEAQRSFLRNEHDRLISLLAKDPGYREIQQLQRDLQDAERSADGARAAEAKAREILADQEAVLKRLLSQEARDVRSRHAELLAGTGILGAAEQPALVERLRKGLRHDGALRGRDLQGWTRQLEQGSAEVMLLRIRLAESLQALKGEGGALEQERADLEGGRQRYPDGPAALLHLLHAKLKGARDPKPFCELVEVPNDRWRDAVEGYLNTRRFDVIVAPEEFPRALSLYERNKRSYGLPGRGEVFISGAGLVDSERVVEAGRRSEPHSLAEQVVTDDPLARAYADYVMGDVICCEREDELRRHRTGITDTVMVYRNHVARQTAPEVYRRHYIGERARTRRMEEIDRRLAVISEAVVSLAADIDWLAGAVDACSRARNSAALLPQLVDEAESLRDLEHRVLLLRRQIERVDRSEFEKLDVELREVKADIASIEAKAKVIDEESGALRTRLESLVGEIEQSGAMLQAASAALDAAAAEADHGRRASLEERYARERADRQPTVLREVFERQYRNIESRVANLVQELVSLKTSYMNAHGFVAEVVGAGFAEFEEERQLWRESRLPEYRERISQARQEAIQQLAEDIIFRLRENLVDVRRQVEDLNRALKDVSFGSERYQFTLEVAPEHREFYGLIMQAGSFERDSIFGEAALSDPGARKTLEDLFGRLTSAEARQVKTELESRADYREYFDYDLKIQHADGSVSLYDRVAGDKSGGETQNPYYIAIFASMFRLYRRLSPDGKPTCGLVLLDEAFSKMDEARIAATLRFARELGLQLVLATPKERSELVAPSVETSLYIHRDALSGVPTVLDFTKEFQQQAESPT